MTKLLCVESSVEFLKVGKHYPASQVPDHSDLFYIVDEEGDNLCISLNMDCGRFQIVENDTLRLFEVSYTKDDGPVRKYQIPAKSAFNACVRLGQIYGDDKDCREDVFINVIEVKG